MAGVFSKRKWVKPVEGEEFPAPKRISTPAGMRLSVILNDNTRKNLQSSRSNVPAPLSISREIPEEPFTAYGDVESFTKEPNSAKTTSTPRAYSLSVYSEKQALPENGSKKRRRGLFGAFDKTTCVIILVVFTVLLLAAVIGLAVGLTRKHKR